ncbi:geranylgeranyl reductase family protein [Micromonospora pisi]|uniref:Geranylgeranyl reductase family protein n=1 Tax=Micromonospora pisi TaxID=589240 RepID=A0A495JQT9_9ACTN|nr:geranylgeranyl reductase family protein [Micromonospora pisi]RKR90734.1 geranylgeranyl reductase family protein [Micromonospora pisi]
MARAAGPDRLDAVVVGAGPAGSATAYHLARRGRRVLLVDRRDFPRDKSCGDGLTRRAVRLLGEMGVLEELTGAARVGGVRIRMRGRGSRDFWYDGDGPLAYGMVVPRLELDAKLCHRAVRAGATLWSDARATYLLGEPGAVRGVEIEREGRRMAVRAPVVVAADGAASGLGRQAGLRSGERDRTGFAARGYFADVTGVDPLLEIHLPLFDVTERHLLPSYGWVFPVGGGVVNVGVGLFDPAHRDSVRGLYERFLSELTRDDPRFHRARPVGRMSGAPLRLDFDPERCGVPGLLLVGDAAGLASPFTGEGISLALESGVLAAARIDEALHESADGPIDPAPYARALADRHAGHFEAGRETARRYLLAWRVLESTFDDDRPIFDLCRRLVLFPDGARAQRLLGPLPALDPALGRVLRRDLNAVADLLTGCVRDDWPMFVGLAAPDEELAAVALRPSVLLLLAGYVGRRRHPLSHALAAAVDLGMFAGLAMDGAGSAGAPPGAGRAGVRSGVGAAGLPGARVPVPRSGPISAVGAGGWSPNPRPVPWGSRFAILAADYLLARAYELAAQGGAAMVAEFAEALTASCEARAGQWRQDRQGGLVVDHAVSGWGDPAGRTDWSARGEALAGRMAISFELPCRLGARLGGASGSVVNALASYGRNLGVSRALAGELGSAIGDGDAGRSTEITRVRDEYARRAREALARVPDGPARDLLHRLAEPPVTGAAPARPGPPSESSSGSPSGLSGPSGVGHHGQRPEER